MFGMIEEPDTALGEPRFKGINVGKGLIGGNFTQERPEVLGRVEFRGVGRQDDELEVAGDVELCRAVPGGAVKHHKSKDVCWERSGEIVEVKLHGLGVGQRQDERVGGAAVRMNGSEDIAPLIVRATGSGRTLTYGCPDAAVAGLEAKACFILKAQPDALVGLDLAQFSYRSECFFERQLVLQDSPLQDAPCVAVAWSGAGAARSASP